MNALRVPYCGFRRSVNKQNNVRILPCLPAMHVNRFDEFVGESTMDRLGRAGVLALLLGLGIPYALVIAVNCAFGWPISRPGEDRYSRALHPTRVLKLSYAVAQQVTGMLRYAPLFLRMRWFYSRAETVTKDIEYGRNGNTLDLWRPSGMRPPTEGQQSPQQLADKPVFVFVFGGAWATGDKDLYGLLAQSLADKLGAIVCIPNYSIYPKGIVTDMLHDLEDTIAWIKSSELVKSLGGEPDQVILCGHSAGGHLAALLAVELAQRTTGEVKMSASVESSAAAAAEASSLLSSVRGVIGISGVYHIMDHYRFEAWRGVEDISCMWRVMEGLDNFEKHSPRLRLEALDSRQISRLPPFVLIHGTEDDIVPLSASENFATALGNQDVPVSVVIIQGGGHASLVVDMMEEGRHFYTDMVTLMGDKVKSLLKDRTPYSHSE